MADDATWPDTGHCGKILVTWYRRNNYIINYMVLRIKKIVLFQIIIGGYLQILDEFWYNFDTVFYPFLKTGTSDRTNIGRNQHRKCWAYTPFNFTLNSPFNWHILCCGSSYLIPPCMEYIIFSVERISRRWTENCWYIYT